MRESGILMHITSLPAPYGIGTMGKDAYAFVDFLVKAGQRVASGDALAVMGNTGNAALADPPYRHCHLEVRAAAGGVGLDPTVYAGCENAVGVYGAAGRMQVITVGPVTQGDADAVLEVCRARGLVDAGLYRSEWRDA